MSIYFVVMLFFCHTAAEPSENSFLQLLKLPKVLLICFLMFTLSSGLGFLDTTLSLYAIQKVNPSVTMLLSCLWVQKSREIAVSLCFRTNTNLLVGGEDCQLFKNKIITITL